MVKRLRGNVIRLRWFLVGLCFWLGLVLACGDRDAGVVTPTGLSDQMPSWACPSVTPVPYGESGPVKSSRSCGEDLDGDGEGDDTCYTYYERYEQEYGLPLTEPTAYTNRNSANHRLGHIVNFSGSTDFQVTISAQEVAENDEFDLVLVRVVWDSVNPQGATLFPQRQVSIRTVILPSGGALAGPWNWSPESARANGDEPDALAKEVALLATGEIEVPIFIPKGSRAESVEIRLDTRSRNTSGGTQEDFRVSFINESEPYCSHAAGIPHWSEAKKRPQTIVGMQASGGRAAVVAAAMSLLGYQYCWGGKGHVPCDGGGRTPPCAVLPCYDCSGLTHEAYLLGAGIDIGHGTQNQALLPAVPRGAEQPGDLLLINGYVHVGILVGDVDGDGTMDMVHAPWYDAYGAGSGIGTGIEYNVMNSSTSHIDVIVRPPLP